MSLKIEGVTKAFGRKLAVDRLSFEMDRPGIFGLIGTNGAGKTTTIRVILGIMEPNEGSVQWNGKAVSKDTLRVGYMPEERGIYMKAKVEEQLAYFGRLHGMEKAAAQSAAAQWMERLGLSEYKGMNAEKLSKGNQQKVQLAATLLHDPELIVLDEPFSGLDPINTETFKAVVSEQRERGKFIILSSHQMATVEEYCENLVLLHKGKTVLSGNLSKIKAGYGHTRLSVSPGEEMERAAARLGLTLLERRADSLEFAVSGDGAAKGFFKALADSDACPTRFELREPSLHELFIEKVGEVS